MKKSGSVINVLAFCILIATFLADVLLHCLHILQQANIGPEIAAKIARVAAALLLLFIIIIFKNI